MRQYPAYSIIKGSIVAVALICATSEFAHAEKVCVKTRVVAGRVKTVRKEVQAQCPRGYTEILDTAELLTTGISGIPGPTGVGGEVGPPGLDGKDGALDVYGSGTEDINMPDGAGPIPVIQNVQFRNIYIGVGRVINIYEITTLRCTGSFTNNGTIRIYPYQRGVENSQIYESESFSSYAVTHPGIAKSLPEVAEVGWNTALVRGGLGGKGLTVNQALSIITGLSGVSGGGSSLYRGAAGGGALTVLCNGPIVNNGTITARGENVSDSGGSGGGGGGGGGGIVILASRTSVTNTGTVTVRGGVGSNSSSFAAAGGGGGGGLVHFLAPSALNEGVVDTLGGAPGVVSGPVTDTFRYAGAGGGASAGDGGTGGSIPVNDSSSGATSGGVGYFLITQKDPTGLF